MIEEPVRVGRDVLEERFKDALGVLTETGEPVSATLRQGHMALLKRWYYRPEAKRTGEIFFPDNDEQWPVKAILRGVGRIFGNKYKSTSSA